MKALITINVRGISVIILFIMMLSSCSIGNKFSSKKPSYHLNLVKAEQAAKPAKTEYEANSLSAIKQMLPRESLSLNTAYEIPATPLYVQKADQQKHKNLPKVDFSVDKNVKIRTHQLAAAFPVRDRSALLDRPIGIFLICILCTLGALACFLLGPQIPFLYFIGYLVGIAAFVFFAVWLIAVAEYYYD